MSRPNQVRIMLVLAFLLTLVAGAVVGAGLARSSQDTRVIPPPPTVTPPTSQPATQPSRRPDRNFLTERLGLTSQQQEAWAKIWKDSPHDKLRTIGERERACYQERDKEIAALYSSDVLVERDRIYQDYRAKWEELRRDRDKAIAALYTPQQKAERERIEKECTTKVALLKADREKELQPFMDKSRALLTEDQRKKFDSMLKGPGPSMGQGTQMGSPDRHRSGNSGGSPGSRRGPGTQPSTRPSAPSNAPPPAEGR
jgi:hypothetical protein